jgi:cytochrome c553
MKQLYLASSVALLFGLSGCSDNAQERSQKEKAKELSGATPKIEIVQNSNAHAIKVEQKDGASTEGNSYYYDYGEKSAYDQNAQPANKDASVRVRPRTAIDANMNVRSPYEEVQVSMLVKKLSKNFIVRCSPCHNDYANGIIGPSLLDRDADYIYTKIEEFKTGKKSNPLMRDLIKQMSDAEIKSMAEEIYSFNKEIKAMRNK